MKKVLIITYYWPPGSSPGVQRFLKFVKYLKDFGWKPYILTVNNGSYPSRDESLLNDVPSGLEVYRTKTFEPYRMFNLIKGKRSKSTPIGFINLSNKKNWLNYLSLYIRANFFIPDARKGWNRFAINKAKEIILKNKIDAIITTGPPQSTHLIGHKLKMENNIPWIADLRDPWTNVYYNTFFPRTKRTKKAYKKLEDKVVKTADMVTVVSAGLKNEFAGRAKEIEIIYNGFDESDFKDIKIIQPSVFTLAYVGNFKPNQNIKMIWESLSEISKTIENFKSDFKLLLTGNIDAGAANDLRKYDIDTLTEIQPFLPHDDAVSQMCNVSMLLFVVPEAVNNHLIITGKLFEYIASGTPILSIGPVDGDACKLLMETGRFPMIDYGDKEGFKKMLVENYRLWQKNGKLRKHEKQDIDKYSRRGLTKKLSEKLNKITGEH
ncbi:MAG: glycosyltransferase [Bacteroidales bacterium]|nr:glycosyltransferase [Bacteroidales bacterium]